MNEQGAMWRHKSFTSFVFGFCILISVTSTMGANVDWDKKASDKEISACRKAFTAACLKPVPCPEGKEGLEICVKNMCDPIPTEVRNHDGSIVTADLWSWDGDQAGMVVKGEIQPLIWIGGKNETGINMSCGLQYEAQAIIKHFARRAGAQQPDVTTASASSVNRSRATSEAQCMQKIIAIQKRGDADAKASRGNVVGQGRALYAASRAQKELFEGDCASHPQASSYVSSGEAGMREWGDKCEQAGGGTDCSGSGPVQASSSLSQSNSRELGQSSAAPSFSSDSDSDTSSLPKGVIVDGKVTELCVKYKPLQVDGVASWFQFTNGCNEAIFISHGNAGSNYLGSRSELRAGESTKSWYLNTKYNGVRYIACKAKINGKDVRLDKKSGQCYYRP